MEGSLDRISGLPEGILHHILSFVLTTDVIRTAATCKRLNHIWSTLPYLDLGPEFFPVLPPPPQEEERAEKDEDEEMEDGEEEEEVDYEGILRKREMLFNFVERTLTRRRMQDLTIHKFRLHLTKSDVELKKCLDRWIQYLVHCNIKEFALRGSFEEPQEEWYNLPSILFTATSLGALTLQRCRLPCGSIALASLKKLHLEHVFLDERILKDIINCCHVLEDFDVSYCRGLGKRIQVSGLSQLRFLELKPHYEEVVDEVVVDAQNLERLTYQGGISIKINIITNFGGMLNYLYLCGANITNTWFCELISRLPRLEELRLTQLSLKAIEISSSSLKRLTLSHVFRYKGNKVGEFRIQTPNLVYLKFVGTLSEVFLNRVAVKEVVLGIDDFRPIRKKAEELYSKLTQFLHQLDYSEVVRLDCTYFENMIFPVEKRLNMFAPLAHIQHLILQGRFHTSPLHSLVELLETMSWMSPNSDNLSLRDNYFDKEAFPMKLKFTADQCECSAWTLARGKFELEDAAGEVHRCLSNHFKHNCWLKETVVSNTYCNPET